jgi:hypothetical protein
MLSSQIRSPEKTRSIPRRWAAAAPSTADGLLGGRRVEVAALGDAGAHGAQQAEAGGVDGEGVGVDGGDERAAVDVAVTEPVSWTWVTASMRPIMAGAAFGQLGGAGRRGSGRFGPRAGWCRGRRSRSAARPSRRGEPEDGHDGGHADGDAQRGEAGSELAGAQPHRGEAGQVRRSELASPPRVCGGGHDWVPLGDGTPWTGTPSHPSPALSRRSGRRASRSAGPCAPRCPGRG